MARRAKVKLNHHNIGRILTGDAMYSALEADGERVLANVKEAAPVDTGEYRDGLRLERALTDRAVVRIVSDDPGAFAIEVRAAPMGIGLMRSKHG